LLFIHLDWILAARGQKAWIFKVIRSPPRSLYFFVGWLGDEKRPSKVGCRWWEGAAGCGFVDLEGWKNKVYIPARPSQYWEPQHGAGLRAGSSGRPEKTPAWTTSSLLRWA
jgi:hypothetical protein